MNQMNQLNHSSRPIFFSGTPSDLPPPTPYLYTQSTMTLSPETQSLINSLSPGEPFLAGAQKLAAFFRKSEETCNPAQIMREILDRADLKLTEYCIFSFLEITRSDIDLMNSALRFKQLERLIRRCTLFPDTLSDKENGILDRLTGEIPLRYAEDIDVVRKVTRKWSEALFSGKNIPDEDRKELALLLRCESESLKAHLEILSDNVNSYNMKAIGRLLPYLTIGEEHAKSIDELAVVLEENKPLGEPVSAFELEMKDDGFTKWFKKLSQDSTLSVFTDLLSLQRHLLIPVRRLTAIATICRGLQDNDSGPALWILQALKSCTREGFRIEAGDNLPKVSKHLANCGIRISDDTLAGDFSSASLTGLIGTDMLTRQLGTETEPSVADLVKSCLNNDALLCRLLDNPKVYNTPGLVERIVNTSRSLFVLTKIARSRELCTGPANRGVPLALLKNPTNIPISLLRTLINPWYVSLSDMKDLLRYPFGIRSEVYSEVKAYVERRR